MACPIIILSVGPKIISHSFGMVITQDFVVQEEGVVENLTLQSFVQNEGKLPTFL
jgi:hypothetical protein